MQIDRFFHWLGEFLGDALRVVVDALSTLFAGLWVAIDRFFDGLARSLGVNPSLINLVVLIIGVWMLYRGIRALVRRAFVAGIVWLFLGLLVLGWLIR
ncbi:hypothetical protein SAMN05421509_11077 [Chromohalobacter canadensis]|uniref:Uncharacterized protein n=1 Tax=Chromohalobacter canadensis TaxID=141389 RepID=A0A285VYC1_9GAMM|nr:hypothetical protein [Chromohalobacter canadensis]SOC57671.1 hypothetical protein SAMN05421509_11077 [Chromohalobacter canadensis]